MLYLYHSFCITKPFQVVSLACADSDTADTITYSFISGNIGTDFALTAGGKLTLANGENRDVFMTIIDIDIYHISIESIIFIKTSSRKGSCLNLRVFIIEKRR